jgi:cysteine synthase A
VNLYVKVEAFNLLGSVKDRLALGVIEEAERTDPLFFCALPRIRCFSMN